MAHLFGPVPSRRLGRSLGIDLIPLKTCPFDCIYCEVGPTTCQTRERLAYDTDAILAELDQRLGGYRPTPDYITLAGSGEPTLNIGLGRIIEAIKTSTDVPVAVLTNGALFSLPEVRRELSRADVVLPSLDAAREETFIAINRPVPGLTLEDLLAGLIEFRREFAGQIWLEVMLLKGLNDSVEDLGLLRQILRMLAPNKIQLNTAVRPVVEDLARPLSRREMAAAAALIGGPVEVIASFDREEATPSLDSDADFLAMLSRRPMTASDLAQVLGLPLPRVRARLKRLKKSGSISFNRYHDQTFYRSQLKG